MSLLVRKRRIWLGFNSELVETLVGPDLRRGDGAFFECKKRVGWGGWPTPAAWSADQSHSEFGRETVYTYWQRRMTQADRQLLMPPASVGTSKALKP